jgi:hypothetical protein
MILISPSGAFRAVANAVPSHEGLVLAAIILDIRE